MPDKLSLRLGNVSPGLAALGSPPQPGPRLPEASTSRDCLL